VSEFRENRLYVINIFLYGRILTSHTRVPPVVINGFAWNSAHGSPCKTFAPCWVSWRHFNEGSSVPDRAVAALLIFNTFYIRVGKRKQLRYMSRKFIQLFWFSWKSV